MHAPSRTDWAGFEPGEIPTKSHMPQLERWLDTLQPPAHVLDLGCGAGACTRMLLERGFSVTAVDINAQAIEQLHAALPDNGVALHVRDIASASGLSLGAARFDAVLCQLVASVVGDAEDRAALLSNAHAVMRQGASLFVSCSGVSDDLNAEYAALYARDARETGEHGSYLSRAADGRVLYRTHHFTRTEIEAWLHAHGFGAVHVEEQIESSSRRPDQRARFYYATCERI